MKQKTEWLEDGGVDRNHWLSLNKEAAFWCHSDLRWVNFSRLALYIGLDYVLRSAGGKILGDQDETKD